jgi:hypothetical protein
VFPDRGLGEDETFGDLGGGPATVVDDRLAGDEGGAGGGEASGCAATSAEGQAEDSRLARGVDMRAEAALERDDGRGADVGAARGMCSHGTAGGFLPKTMPAVGMAPAPCRGRRTCALPSPRSDAK